MNSPNEINKEKIEVKDLFIKLKSNYILKKLFNNLLKRKSLDIIKYNKYIKNRINISNEDYKEYSEIYSSIELEIKVAKDKYGKFINIKEENEMYYHIYFNNNKEEIKRNYLNENDNVKIIKIIIDYQIKSFTRLFDE